MLKLVEVSTLAVGLYELTARAVHGDPCLVLLAGILLLILDGDWAL